MKIVTGIGSRNTPAFYLGSIARIAKDLSDLGWVLRSGGAAGADTVFEAQFPPHQRQIFRPGEHLQQEDKACDLFDQKVRPIAGCVSIRRMKPQTRELLARNMFQVLGLDLQTPSTCVICWTPTLDYSSFDAGGTRYAVILAQVMGVPIFNLLKMGESEVLTQVKLLQAS